MHDLNFHVDVSVHIYLPPYVPCPLQIPAESVLTGTQMHSKYKILRKLATTNTGTVFSGQDRATVEPVAIKVHHKRGASALCVYNEAALHASLDHPNIVKLLAFADLKDDVFMVQEVCVFFVLCACLWVRVGFGWRGGTNNCSVRFRLRVMNVDNVTHIQHTDCTLLGVHVPCCSSQPRKLTQFRCLAIAVPGRRRVV